MGPERLCPGETRTLNQWHLSCPNNTSKEPRLSLLLSLGTTGHAEEKVGEEEASRWWWSGPCPVTPSSKKKRRRVLLEGPGQPLCVAPTLITYTAMDQGGVILIALYQDPQPPFLLHNATVDILFFKEESHPIHAAHCLPAGSTTHFDWDYLEEEQSPPLEAKPLTTKLPQESRPPRTLSLCIPSTGWSAGISLDCESKRESIIPLASPSQPESLSEGEYDCDVSLHMRLERHGPTTYITFCLPHPPLLNEKDNCDELKEEGVTPLVSLRVDCPMVSLCIFLDEEGEQEMMHMSFDDMAFSFLLDREEEGESFAETLALKKCICTTTRKKVTFSMGPWQFDNQLPGYEFPVVAGSKPIAPDDELADSMTNTVELGFAWTSVALPLQGPSAQQDDDNNDNHSNHSNNHNNNSMTSFFVQMVSIQVRPVLINIEAKLILFLRRIIENKLQQFQLASSSDPHARQQPQQPPPRQQHVVKRETLEEWSQAAAERLCQPAYYVEGLWVCPLSADITMHTDGGFYVGAARVPVRLEEISLWKVRGEGEGGEGMASLIESLIGIYTTDSLLWLTPLRIVGSLDLLGNPTVLLQSLGVGLRDLLVLPLRGAREGGVVGLALGIGRGTSSFLRHTCEGSLTSIAELSTSIGRNLEKLTPQGTSSSGDTSLSQGQLALHNNYDSNNKRPLDLGAGVFKGLQELGGGILAGATGLVWHPLQGLIGGQGVVGMLRGFCGGVGVGVLGVVAKPVSGAMGLVANTTWGIMATAGLGLSNRLTPRRTQAKLARAATCRLAPSFSFLPSFFPLSFAFLFFHFFLS